MLADIVEVDAVIADPPYSKETHEGHWDQAAADGYTRPDIGYAHWGEDEIREFVGKWTLRTRGWIVVLTSFDLVECWQDTFESANRYAFHPIPCCIKGMTVRMQGDGPSSWAVYAVMARPRRKEFIGGWTRPGYYVCNATDIGRMKGKRREGGRMIGGKPLRLMVDIVSDYSQRGELVCDPCAGIATTLRAAEVTGRRALGAEMDKQTYEDACERLAAPAGMELFA